MRYFVALCLALELIGFGSTSTFGQAQPRGVIRVPASGPASDADGLSSILSTEALSPTGHRYALCIGIDNYKPDSGYPALHCAVADAKSLGAVFAALGYRTTVMTDDGTGINNGGKPDPNLVPTCDNIKRELQEFARQAKSPDDELVVSYAGHGDVFDNQAAIVPLDYSRADGNLVTVTRILGPLTDPQCRARSKLLLLDACHSGKGNRKFFFDFTAEKSLMVFSACSALQSSMEDVALGHGRFTEVLLWGLVGHGFSTAATQPASDAAVAQWNGEAYAGGSEFLSANDLSKYVGEKFLKNGWSGKTPGPGASDDSATGQNPQMFGKQDVTVPMIVARRAVSTPPPLSDEDRQTITETFAKAKAAYTMRNWVSVIHHATTVLRIEDANSAALALRAMGNLHATYVNQADDDAQAALQADPNEAEAMYVRGMCAVGRNDKPRASSYLKAAGKLIDADPAKWPLLTKGEDATYRTLAMGIVAADGQEAVDCLTQAAASPDLSPQAAGTVAVAIGRKYQNGSGIPQDNSKAMEWYLKGSDEGDSTAMLAAGTLYEDGHDGVPPDYTKAMALYTKAADAGQETAMYNLANLYQQGLGIQQDYAKAMSWYRKAADVGNAAAMNRIGYMCEHGQGGPQDYALAMSWYLKSAGAGNAMAMNNIGSICNNGLGVSQDYAQAMSWYLKAADAGNPMAMNNIGSLYDHGLGVPQDYAQAMSWYRKAADLGSAEAIGSIGYLYDAGHGVSHDYVQAMAWYRRASDAGNAVAMFNIGRMYADGRGVPRDYVQAMVWYRKATDAGYVGSMDEIGVLYDNGNGVPRDYAQAMICYHKAADAGNAHSMYHIAVLYENGRGVTKDLDQARTWYRKAADLGDDDSKKWLAAHSGK